MAGWISKRVFWGVLAGCLPLLVLVCYNVFDLSFTKPGGSAGLLIVLAIAVTGPPISGIIAAQFAKSFERAAT